MRNLVLLSFLLSLLLWSSCAPRSGASGGGAVSLVKTFKRTDGSTMYFAGPMHYRSDSKGQLAIDFTLNKFPNQPGSVICNFTYRSKSDADFKPQTFLLAGDGISAEASQTFELFFAEKSGKVYTYRYSTTYPEAAWLKWLNTDRHSIIVNATEFEGGKKHRKHLREVRDRIVFPLSQ